jgi:YfiH family protein
VSLARATSLAARLAEAGLDWIVPDWPVANQVHGFVTTRTGGVSAGPYATLNLGSAGGDDAATVAENRRRVEAFLPSPPLWLQQVHGNTVAIVDRETLGSSPVQAPVADAAVTREANIVLAVRIADCLPVLFAHRRGIAIGIAHAGWRGLARGVLENTLAAMNTDPADIVVWLGPAIGPDAFEVGQDVYDAFTAADAGAGGAFRIKAPGKWRADLYALARRRLASMGIRGVYGGGHCTYTEAARFFSYRRERDSGRMAALLWMAS